MLDWSKYKSINNSLYTPRLYSCQFVLMVAVIALTLLYWFTKDMDRFLVEALFHTFITFIISIDYLIALYRFGKFGVPLLEFKEGSIFVRQNGHFKVKKYRLGRDDKVFVVGRPEKKYIRIERINGETLDIRFSDVNSKVPVEFICDILSNKMTVSVKSFPIEPV